MRRRTVRITALAIAAATLAGGAAAFATGSTTGARMAPSRTMHVVEKGGTLKIVDNPPKAKHQYDFSAGDIVVVSRDLYTPRNVKQGSLRIVCVATGETTQQCTGTETLPDGTLELAGVSSPSPDTTVAVVGGSGIYTAARGTSVSRDRTANSDVADQTLTLRY